jgi:allantoinase
MPDLVIRARRVVTPEGVRAAAVHVERGVIAAVQAFDSVPQGPLVETVPDHCVLMPGLVDTHVHINEPGRADWEGFQTATRAAAAGGVTTLIEMPLNSVPATTTVAAYREKLAAAPGQLHVDVGFWGGVVPGNTPDLAPLWDAGVFGFKCFLVPSGVPEFAHVTESDLRAALPELKRLDATLLVHAELPSPIESALREQERATPRLAPSSHRAWLAARPRAAENEAIALMIRLCGETGARVHIVHLSSSDALPHIQRARADKLPLTVETCPHYLTFAAEEIPDGATEYKCAPPLRERLNREALWAALWSGMIDLVATDHSPAPPAMKQRDSGDFLRAWGGIASLQLSLPAVWTEARQRGFPVDVLARWLGAAPASLAGLNGRKGVIAGGADADFVAWDPDAEFRVEPDKLHHRHKLTPYAGRTLRGVVRQTWLRGAPVFSNGQFTSGATGNVLKRGGT